MSNTTKRFLMAASGGKKSTYIDDVFSTYVYRGDETHRTIPTGVDNTKGALAWVKSRNDTHNHHLVDTERGANKILQLYSNATDAESTISNRITGFTDNGFNLGSAGQVNGTDAYKYVGWNFRKSKGFFDCIKYTGTGATSGSPQTIEHSLESIPGMIIIKNLTQASQWFVYHVGLGEDKFLQLNKSDAAVGYNGGFTNITSSSIGVFDSNSTNTNEFIAYVFAGGGSTATGASSCSFNGTSGLDVPASSSVNLGTGTFCLECWVYLDNAPGSGSPSYARVFQLDGPTGNNGYANLQITINPSNNTLHAWAYGGGNPVAIVGNVSLLNGWHHIAVVRDSTNKITQYVDGYADGHVDNVTTNFNPNSGSPRMRIGYYSSGNGVFDGKISNLRVTVGEPVYTGDFIPSPIPLTTSSQVTTSSNVKLLCCNDISNPTGATVTPGSIANNGTNPVAFGFNPFDDPAGFVFGENEDQGVVKCGRYIGNGASSDGPEINLGWEPQWILIKHNSGDNWVQFDSMRGVVSEHKDAFLSLNSNASEDYGGSWWLDFIDFTSTGFKLKNNYNITNQLNGEYLFVAIRRPDGYVGKPAEVGTDVFTVVNGDTDGNAKTPFFLTPHYVDFALFKGRNITHNWGTSPRLTQGYYLSVNQTRTENANIHQVFDFMDGFNDGTDTSGSYTGWLWKRHAGFDLVTDKGDGEPTKQIVHGLGVVPEMIWRKNRDNGSDEWQIYHIGLNGGTNPHLWRIYFTSAGQTNDAYTWVNAPTARHFTVGPNGAVNRTGEDFATMLFASVDGISKVGYYDGSDSAQTITTGFQPRFLFIKVIDTNREWQVLDTVRGWGAGNDERLFFDGSGPQANDENVGEPTSTGFTLATVNSRWNSAGSKYIYYAHA